MRCVFLFAITAWLQVEPVWSNSLLRGHNDPKTIEVKNIAKCEVSTEVDHMSQYREDEIVFNTFFLDPLKCEGTVVEIGGFNGKRYSNSWFFQYALNWRALLVEASPTNFAKMVENRPDAINVFGAVCTGTSTKFRTGTNRATGGIADDMSQFHKDRWVDDTSALLDVRCLLLSDLLKNNGIGHVDVLFLDVEGGELTVLDTFDWSIPIDMFIVELDGTNEQKDDSVRTTLRAHGYITPLSMYDECRIKQDRCAVNELFVLESVWNERKKLAAST